jgi:hypothetical protein
VRVFVAVPSDDEPLLRARGGDAASGCSVSAGFSTPSSKRTLQVLASRFGAWPATDGQFAHASGRFDHQKPRAAARVRRSVVPPRASGAAPRRSRSREALGLRPPVLMVAVGSRKPGARSRAKRQEPPWPCLPRSALRFGPSVLATGPGYDGRPFSRGEPQDGCTHSVVRTIRSLPARRLRRFLVAPRGWSRRAVRRPCRCRLPSRLSSVFRVHFVHDKAWADRLRVQRDEAALARLRVARADRRPERASLTLVRPEGIPLQKACRFSTWIPHHDAHRLRCGVAPGGHPPPPFVPLRAARSLAATPEPAPFERPPT